MQLRAQEEFLGSMKNQLILFSTDLRFGGCCYLLVKLCPTLLCDPMDCSPPCSSVHRISQARVLGWVAISFSRGSSQPRDRTRVSRIAGRGFTVWVTRLLLKLKLQYFGHLMRRTDSLEKTLIPGKTEGRKRRRWQRMRWLDGITDSMDMS